MRNLSFYCAYWAFLETYIRNPLNSSLARMKRAHQISNGKKRFPYIKNIASSRISQKLKDLWHLTTWKTVDFPTVCVWLKRRSLWSVGGSNLQAIAEHVETKGKQHAIFFHPTTHSIIWCSSTNLICRYVLRHCKYIIFDVALWLPCACLSANPAIYLLSSI